METAFAPKNVIAWSGGRFFFPFHTVEGLGISTVSMPAKTIAPA